MTAARGERILLVVGEGGDGQRTAPPGDVAGALEDAAYTVERHGSPQACLGRLEETEVAAVVSEHAPPDVDGLQLLRSIRVSNPSLPVFLLPASADATIAGEAVAASVDGYIGPSQSPATVVRRLEACLERAVPTVPDASWDRYRHLVEISPVPINLFDGDGTCIWGNDAVLDLLDLDSRADLVGRSIFEFIHPEDRAIAREEVESVVEQKRSVGPTAMRLVTDDGDVRHVQVATAVGELLGTSIGQAIALDVSEQTLQERHLTVLDTWLRHNIRNELNLVQGLAERIENGEDADPAATAGRIRGSASHLVSQANRQRRLIGLLQRPPDPVRTDLAALAERRVASARADYEEAEIVTGTLADVSVLALPELEDAVAELIENAIEHADAPDPTVTLSVERAADGAGVLCVRDDGPGIPDEEREILQIDSDIDQIHHSSGLGLVFVYWAVVLADGTVDFEVGDAGGTTVSLTLPAAGDA